MIEKEELSKPIKLYWADKFRELSNNDNGLTDLEVINLFLDFCKEEEKKINERFNQNSKL